MWKSVMSVLVLLFFQSAITFGQIKDSVPSKANYNKGMMIGISDAQMIDRLLTVVKNVGTDSREMFMERTVKPYMMPARDIGNEGNSLAYAITNCLEYYLNLNNNYKDNLSPDYIYLNTNSPQRKATADEMFSFVVITGTVSAAIMPYYSKNIPLGANAVAKVKAQNYLHVFYETAKTSFKLFEIRKALTRGHPVIVELSISKGFRNLKDSRYWLPDQEDNTPDGSQYIIVVGFDEQRRAVEIQNSWGIGWGNDGYLWINYDDFGKYARNGFVILP